MFKAVKRPMEYIAIKVPEDCEDIGKFVGEKAVKAGIRLDIIGCYADGGIWTIEVGVKNNEAKTVKRGSVIVCEISQDGSKYPESVDVLSQEDFDKKFKPVDAKPLLAKLNEIEDGMFTKAEGMSLPDCANVPHVRIEFDDVNDAPHIWIDGKQVDKLPGNGLVSVDLNWHTRDQTLVSGENNHYKIEYLDLDGDKRVGIAQGNLPSNDLFKQ
ncbi:hypothetical protein LH991_11715 [Schleiferilactobacillus harbinensis]|nr:hypothetical protein [Schleiferilactobacillus harbinensis]QFR64557.1 hypothetical protein LH991_11715 [Schleiferilactobacillus harbinensis]